MEKRNTKTTAEIDSKLASWEAVHLSALIIERFGSDSPEGSESLARILEIARANVERSRELSEAVSSAEVISSSEGASEGDSALAEGASVEGFASGSTSDRGVPAQAPAEGSAALSGVALDAASVSPAESTGRFTFDAATLPDWARESHEEDGFLRFFASDHEEDPRAKVRIPRGRRSFRIPFGAAQPELAAARSSGAAASDAGEPQSAATVASEAVAAPDEPRLSGAEPVAASTEPRMPESDSGAAASAAERSTEAAPSPATPAPEPEATPATLAPEPERAPEPPVGEQPGSPVPSGSAADAEEPAQKGERLTAADLARFSLVYSSRDGSLLFFEDAGGHITAVDASKLA